MLEGSSLLAVTEGRCRSYPTRRKVITHLRQLRTLRSIVTTPARQDHGCNLGTDVMYGSDQPFSDWI